jgi:hypothetical protein
MESNPKADRNLAERAGMVSKRLERFGLKPV